MYNKKSDYAINKRNPDAIVYPDADGNEIKLTRDDFASEEEFLRWKAWSDAEYKQAEKNGRGYYDHTVALIDDADTYGETLEDELISLADKLEHDEKCAAMVAQIREVLTETQFRRLWLHAVCRKTEKEIAAMENAAQQNISLSIRSAKKKIEKIFDFDKKTPCKNP